MTYSSFCFGLLPESIEILDLTQLDSSRIGVAIESGAHFDLSGNVIKIDIFGFVVVEFSKLGLGRTLHEVAVIIKFAHLESADVVDGLGDDVNVEDCHQRRFSLQKRHNFGNDLFASCVGKSVIIFLIEDLEEVFRNIGAGEELIGISLGFGDDFCGEFCRLVIVGSAVVVVGITVRLQIGEDLGEDMTVGTNSGIIKSGLVGAEHIDVEQSVAHCAGRELHHIENVGIAVFVA